MTFNIVAAFLMYLFLGNLSWSQSAASIIRSDDPQAVLLSLRCLELILQTVIFYYALRTYVTKILKQECSYFRITFQNIRSKWIIAGMFAPLVLVSIYILFFPGSFERGTLSVATGISMTFLHGGLKAGVTEEILFRGFYMKLFENRWNKATAILLNSFFFAFIHLGNASELSNIEIATMFFSYTAAGITFSLITYQDNSVSNTVFMHAIWNIIAESNLLCIVTSPHQYDANAIFNYRIQNLHPLLGGGFFGISASMFAILAFLSPLLLLLQRRKSIFNAKKQAES